MSLVVAGRRREMALASAPLTPTSPGRRRQRQRRAAGRTIACAHCNKQKSINQLIN